ncbi:MAG: T9SS type A sorting domain-containing protein [Bacteroidales bacterium]|nr:T9SS type A sorting domain-containing protein [Bacteroidales bacterium]
MNFYKFFKVVCNNRYFGLFFIFVFIFLIKTNILSQVTGDYRSAGSGNWTTLATWQRYNGSSWVTPITGQGYPGQFTGTGEVLIQSGHIVTIGTTGLTTFPMGTLTIDSPNGQLYLNGGNSTTNYSLNTMNVVIKTTSGSIYFRNKASLILPLNGVLFVGLGGLVGDCSNNAEIRIGNKVFAACKGAPGDIYTFDELMTAGTGENPGGTINAIPSSNSPICSGATINLTGGYSGAVVTAPTYYWSVIAPNDVTTTYTSQNVNISSALVGNYIATLTVSSNNDGTIYTNSETINVLVNPFPTLTGATQANPVCEGTGALINLTGLLPNTTFSLNYSINSVPQPTIEGLISNTSGISNFTTVPLSISNDGQNLLITGITITSSTSNCYKAFTQNLTLSVLQNGSWTGVISSDWNNSENWCGGIPDASTDVIIRASATNQPIISSENAFCKNININSDASLTIISDKTLNVSGNWINNGTFNPDKSSVIFTGTTIISGTAINSFYNINITGSLTASLSNINIAGNWNNSGTFIHNNGTLTFNGIEIQNINSGGSAFYNLSLINNNNTCTALSNIIVEGVFNTSQNTTLDMATFALNVNNVEHLGTLLTQNTSATPITSAKNWGGLVNYNSAAPQTLSSGLYNNLTVSTPGGATANGDITVNGILNLPVDNPNETNGLLEMTRDYGDYSNIYTEPSDLITTKTQAHDILDSYILNLGANALITGIGDVTGRIKRSYFENNKEYTFGNSITTIKFNNNTSGTLPSEIMFVITKGNDRGIHSNKIDAVARLFQVIRNGGTSPTTFSIKFGYSESELNGNNETELVVWDHHIPYTSDNTPHKHGKASQSLTDNWISLPGHGINYLNTSEVIGGNTKYWMIAGKMFDGIKWLGADIGDETNWNNPANWTAGRVPNENDDIIIPLTAFGPTFPSGPVATVKSITIESGATVNGADGILYIKGGIQNNGGTGSWNNYGTFNPGNSSVIFDFPRDVNNETATLAGSSNFYDITISANTFMMLQYLSTISIAGSLTKTGNLDAGTFENTFIYNGTQDQTVILPDNPAPNFYNLILTGTGTKTLPAVDLLINNDLTLSGTAIVEPVNALYIKGNLNIGNGASFTAGSLTHTIEGDFINNGSFNGAGSSLIINGTKAQTIGGTTPPNLNNLSVSNTSNIVTAAVNLNCTGDFNNEGVLDMTDYTLYVNGAVLNAGTVKTASTSPAPLPLGKTWGGTVEYTVATGSQEIAGGSFNNLTLYNSIGNNTANGNLIINNGTLYITAGGTLDMATNTLSGSGIFNNNGMIKTAVTTASSSTPLPVGKIWNGTIEYTALTGSQTVVSGYYNNLKLLNTSGINIAGGDIDINNELITTLGGTIDMGSAYVLSGGGTFNNNGIIKTSVPSVISSIPIPSGKIWGGTIQYDAVNGSQSIVSGTYNNLIISSTSGVNTLEGNITINNTFNSASGGTINTEYDINFNCSTTCGQIINASAGNVNYSVSAINILEGTYNNIEINSNPAHFCGATIINGNFAPSGILNLSNNLTLNGSVVCGAGLINALSGSVIYAILTGGQNVISGTYYDLMLNNTSGINTACGNLTVNNNISTVNHGTLDMTTFQLLGSLNTISNNGIIETANTSANPIPAGKNWGGIIEYYGNISQKAVGGTFSTLVVSGTGGAIATGNIVVTNDLRLNNNNPSSNQGLLEMASYTLNMGEAAITTGIGDVTGIVKRQHTFLGNIPYTFGSEFSSITFVNYPGSIKPGWLSCRITIGSAPEWRTQAVKRYYSFAKDGGDDRTIINLRYLDSELDVAEPVESNLVIWCAIGPSPDWNNITEVGKSNNDINNNWLSLAGGSIQGIAPSSSLDYKQISFSYSDVTKIIWTGLGVDGEDWALPGNWNGGVPSETDDVYIPAGAPFYPTKNSDVINFPAIINSLEIEEQASVTTTNFDITIKGDAGAWINRGSFYPETRTVTFAPVSVENIVSISGTTNFNNLAIADNAYFQPLADAYILISGGLSAGSGSILDFTTTDNTIEYNGAFQTVINPVGPGSDKGYHNLIISGSGNKTLADNIIITNQLELSASTLFVGNKTLQYNKISINQGVLTTNNTSNIIITGDAANSYIPDYLGTIRDLNNLTVNLTSADAVVYNLSNLHLKGILTLSSGTLNTNNNLTLLSTAAQTALISGSGTGNIIGNISVQRYIPGNSGYHYLSTPVTNATAGSLAAYGYGSPIWGQDYSTYTYGPVSNIWRYDETNISEKIHSTGTIMNGWVSPAGANDFLNLLVGYTLNINSGITAQLIGTAASGLYSINVTKTTSVNPDDDGWNLVGNPYPSPIDWDALNGWTKTNVNNAIYMFKTSDRYTGNYCSYINGVSCDGIISNIIPSMQAFWIKASADGILALDNRVRTEHLNTPFYKKQDIQKPLLRLSVKGVDNELISDNTVVYFDKQASDNFDSNFDAVKLFNSNLTACNLFTLSGDNQKLSINSLNEINYNPIVQLNFTTDIYGYYILKVKDFLNFDFFNSIYLEDLSAHKFIKLNSQTEYKFLYNINEPKQFVLHFNKDFNNIESKIKDNIKIYSSENRINIINLNNDKYELFIYNIIGQEVESQKINNTDYISKVLEKGNYVVKIVSGNNIIVNKITVF